MLTFLPGKEKKTITKSTLAYFEHFKLFDKVRVSLSVQIEHCFLK